MAVHCTTADHVLEVVKVSGYLTRDLQVLSFLGEAGLEPWWVGLEVGVGRGKMKVSGASPWPLLHLPQLDPLALDSGPGASRTSEVVDGVKGSRL